MQASRAASAMRGELAIAFSTYSIGTCNSASATVSSACESPRKAASGASLAGFCSPEAVVQTATRSGRCSATISR